jgi:3-hydroxybutyryl-CoA dehydratase
MIPQGKKKLRIGILLLKKNKEKLKLITEISVGDTFSESIPISPNLHNDFAKLSGDDSPIHTSIEFAKRNGYKGCLGYAFLITTLLSRLYGTRFPGGSELCLKQDCSFPSPYFVGDILEFTITVKNINLPLKLLVVSTVVLNNSQDEVFRGDATFQLKLVN